MFIRVGRIAAPVSDLGDCPNADVRLRASMAAGSARPGLGFYGGGRQLVGAVAVPWAFGTRGASVQKELPQIGHSHTGCRSHRR